MTFQNPPNHIKHADQNVASAIHLSFQCTPILFNCGAEMFSLHRGRFSGLGCGAPSGLLSRFVDRYTSVSGSAILSI